MDKLREILRNQGALQEGHFVLASGKHSEHYVQTAQLMKDPERAEELLEDFFRDQDHFDDVDKVLTAAKGGITVGQQVALVLGAEAVFAERDDNDELILKRGFELSPDEDVLLVEDVVTTGGTLKELKSLARDYGVSPSGAFVLVNRSGREQIDDVPLYALVEFTFPVYDAEECPRCDDGDRAVRPGTKTANTS